MTEKARKAIINYGEVGLEVYQLPDSSYELSQTQVALAIGKPNRSFIEFLGGKSAESLLIQGLEFIEISVEGSGRPIKAIPIKVAILYWSYWADRGNIKAKALLAAGTEETLTRLADQAFGVQKSESQYHQETVINIQQNEQMFLMMERMMQQMENQSQMIQNLSIRFEEVERQNQLMLPDHIKMSAMREVFEEYPNLEEILTGISDYLRNTPNPEHHPLKYYIEGKHLSQGQKIKLGRLLSDWFRVLLGRDLPKKYAYRNSKTLYPDCVMPLINFAVGLIRK